MQEVIDCHVHLWNEEQIPNLVSISESIGIKRMNIVSIISTDRVNDNAAAFRAKREHPGRFFVFGGLDHSEHFSGGELRPLSMAEQIDRLIEAGADGLKLLETKPEYRKMVDIPVDSNYYSEIFTKVEETGLPILWHVADPEEFWNPEKLPEWAKEQGWGYDDSFVSKEQLYVEVENVLNRHPKLKVIFAHFYFLSADLKRASDFLDRFPNVHFDLAPGIEFLYNLSRDVEESRSFFLKYTGRIQFKHLLTIMGDVSKIARFLQGFYTDDSLEVFTVYAIQSIFR